MKSDLDWLHSPGHKGRGDGSGFGTSEKKGTGDTLGFVEGGGSTTGCGVGSGSVGGFGNASNVGVGRGGGTTDFTCKTCKATCRPEWKMKVLIEDLKYCPEFHNEE